MDPISLIALFVSGVLALDQIAATAEQEEIEIQTLLNEIDLAQINAQTDLENALEEAEYYGGAGKKAGKGGLIGDVERRKTEEKALYLEGAELGIREGRSAEGMQNVIFATAGFEGGVGQAAVLEADMKNTIQANLQSLLDSYNTEIAALNTEKSGYVKDFNKWTNTATGLTETLAEYDKLEAYLLSLLDTDTSSSSGGRPDDIDVPERTPPPAPPEPPPAGHGPGV
jgi:hypothetical protein